MRPRLHDDYYIRVSVSTNKKGDIELCIEVSFFFSFRVGSGSRLFIGPRAHDCYLSIDDKRNPIGEARLTRIEKVGEKVGKLA